MNLDLNIFSRMLDAAYGTALDDDRWSDLFEILQQATGIEHFGLHGYDKNLQNHAIAARRRCIYEAFIPSFEKYYWQINPWLSGVAKAPVGRALYTEEICPEKDLRKSEFYNDWVRHLDDIGTGGVIVLFRDETRQLSLGGNIPFSQKEELQSKWIFLLNQLAPHLRNAFELRRQLTGSQLKDAAYLQALDAISNAVFLINAKGKVSYYNPAAQEMLETGAIVFLDTSGTLRSHDTQASQALSKLLFEIGANLAPSAPRQVVLRTPTGFGHAFATVAPFTPDPRSVDKLTAFASGDGPVAIVTVTDTAKTKNRKRTFWPLYTA